MEGSQRAEGEEREGKGRRGEERGRARWEMGEGIVAYHF
jgi:hypothetical protein